MYGNTAIFFPPCIQRENFSGTNTDGSFSTAVSNLFLSPSKKIPQLQIVVVVLLFYVHGKHLRSCRDGQLQIVNNLGRISFYIESGTLRVLTRIASLRQF